jgi:uncharacterized protein (DUF169 family)
MSMLGVILAGRQLPEVPLSESCGTHCALMGRALRGEALQVSVEDVTCPLARHYLGLEQPRPEGVRKAICAWGDAADEEVAAAYLEDGWRLDEPSPFIVYFPYPSGNLEPHLLVKIGSPLELGRLVNEHTRRTGRRLTATVSGLGAACGECTVYPLMTGEANVSLGCGGCRPAMQIEDTDLLLAAPRGSVMFEILAGEA